MSTDLEKLIRDQANHIAQAADAIATGRLAPRPPGGLMSPREAAVRGILRNAETLLAWIEAQDGEA